MISAQATGVRGAEDGGDIDIQAGVRTPEKEEEDREVKSETV